MQLEPDSTLEMGLYLSAGEPETYRLLKRILKPGDCFIDGGANLGYYSLLASTLVGRSGKVVAVEPDEMNLSRLAQNIALNDFSIEIVRAALGSEQGRATVFDLAGGSHAMRTLAPAADGTSVQLNACDVTTVDQIAADLPPSSRMVIKLDIEGGEVAALQGATRTLVERRPDLIVELNRVALARFGTTPSAVVAALRYHGYRMYWPHNTELVDVGPEWDLDRLPHEQAFPQYGDNYYFSVG